MDSPIIFYIPVYNNMPKRICKYPTVMYNPNNRLKSLNIYTADGKALTLTPTFDQTVKNYDLIVDYSVDSVKIAAGTVSTRATVSGNGTVALRVGTDKFTVSVTAENGDVANYTVTIVRSEQKATPTPTPTSAPTPTPTPGPTVKATATPAVTKAASN
jgi:hypothetical protein